MQLDSFTILVASFVALLFLGFSFLYFWNRDRRSEPLLWWTLTFLLIGASVVTYMQPGWETSFWAIAFGNGVRIFALSLLWVGARVFEKRSIPVATIIAAPTIWIGLCLIPQFVTSMPARIVGVSVLNVLFCCLAAYELWRGRAEHLPSRLPAAVVFLSFAVMMAVRVAGVNVLPFPMGAMPLDPLWMGGFNLGVFIHAMFAGFLLVSLTKERAELEQRNQALLDPLTGLMNRRALMGQMERSARRQGYGHERVAVLVLDIDRFKQVNDRFGHETGDRVLAGFAEVAEANVRPTDLLYRMGGEEFCFILQDASVHEAIAVAERIRNAFEALEVDVGHERARTTVSVGVAAADQGGSDLERLLAAADAAVYEAKARGRNRVVLADPALLAEATPDTVVQLRRLA